MIDEHDMQAGPASCEALTSRSTDDFARLYQTQYRRLVQMSYLLLGDQSLAEEVVQDAFANVYQRWAAIADLPYIDGYLGRAVVNGCRMQLRSRVRSSRPMPLTPTTAARDPFDEVMLRSNHRELMDALSELSVRQRECVVARYLLELSEGEAGRLLGVSVGSVRTHTHRGLKALQKRLVKP